MDAANERDVEIREDNLGIEGGREFWEVEGWVMEVVEGKRSFFCLLLFLLSLIVISFLTALEFTLSRHKMNY